MVSASKAARDAKKAEKGLKEPKASKLGSKSKNTSGTATPQLGEDGEPLNPADAKQAAEIKRLTEQMDEHGLSDRVTTGVLSSLKASRDVKITAVSLVFHVS
jgi:ATP-binding cassette subfamily F protein 2